MVLDVLFVVGGLVLLTRAADHLVTGATRTSAALRVSPVVIGVLVVGFGTSAPELLVSLLAALNGSIDLSIANVTGSNVANLTLVLGVAGLVAPLTLNSGTVRREGVLSTVAVLAFGLALLAGLTRPLGVLLAVGLVGALVLLLRFARAGRVDPLPDEAAQFVEETGPGEVRRELARTVLGLVGTLIGAQLTVTGATGLADALGLAEGFVGFTLVAVGTSLPELVAGVQAARVGETDLVLGNVMGSNLFNSLAVGSVAALASTEPPPESLQLPVGLMIGVAVGVLGLLAVTGRIERMGALLLLSSYLVMLPLVAG